MIKCSPLLDMLTNGGLGIAVFSPFSRERFFFPVQPIPVSPIGLSSRVSIR
jgi:inner membrane protein